MKIIVAFLFLMVAVVSAQWHYGGVGHHGGAIGHGGHWAGHHRVARSVFAPAYGLGHVGAVGYHGLGHHQGLAWGTGLGHGGYHGLVTKY